ECHFQVNRYPGALYKSYDVYNEAENTLHMSIVHDDNTQMVNLVCQVAVHPDPPLDNQIPDDEMVVATPIHVKENEGEQHN
ncbi:unnamed protein product, partial [Ilex paraguariensis]